MKNNPLLRTGNNRAIALITVLVIVTLLAILTLAFLSTMDIENRAANSFSDSQRSKMVAQGALAQAIDVLRNNIPEPAPIDKSAATAEALNWAINPGRLTIFDAEGEENTVDLHTGEVTNSPEETTDPDVYSVDLNEPIPGKTAPSICYNVDENGEVDLTTDPPEMRVAWVNILQDPSKEASADNPIIARHAFWIDDESSKLNFNTAYGKPSPEEGPLFHQQYELGMQPLFTQGTEQTDTVFSETNFIRTWALGKQRSVNLDVLFDQLEDIDRDALLAHGFLRGFSRYPEAILDYVNLPEDEKEEWFQKNKYNLTFYSRSPEFNAFGRPRLTTTNIPLSLEGGPNYQMPFIYNGPGAPVVENEKLSGVLHLHSLMGSFGFTHSTVDEATGTNILASNVVNNAQLGMLMRYFGREFPGYENSFIDKYGDEECAQIALNILNMARFATTTMRNGVTGYAIDQAWRTTSVLFAPSGGILGGQVPERLFWQYKKSSGSEPGRFLSSDDVNSRYSGVRLFDNPPDDITFMIPQSPGPFINEVRLVFRPFPARELTAPATDANGDIINANADYPITGGNIIPDRMWLGFRYEIEYYTNPGSPFTRLREFPYKTDFFEVDISSSEAGESFLQRLNQQNWNSGALHTLPTFDADGNQIFDDDGNPVNRRPVNIRRLSSLQVRLNAGQVRAYDPARDIQINRRLVRGAWRYIGRLEGRLGNPEDPRPNINDVPKEFASDSTLNLDIKFRGGMGIRLAGGRARQMIPMGISDRDDEVLDASISIDMSSTINSSISWQIVDPRLSSHKSEWIRDVADDNEAGTPGLPNVGEPEETSDEKSKFRYLQRGPGNISGRPINRPDEYNSASRVSSKGFWSFIHTGIQSGVQFRTIDLAPDESDQSPPDYLLMDLMGATYPLQHDQWKINSTLPDEFSTISFMHSTTGAINLNSKPYPNNQYFKAPMRKKPHEAVFKHLRDDSNIESILQGIETFQENDFFKYVGDLSKVEGYRDPDAEATQLTNEELLRHMIGCLTTKSNTFGVWGVGQTVQKARYNDQNWGVFEDGDTVQGEKRFFALVERYIWPGIDGVPGNAHVSAEGVWDRHAKQAQDIVNLDSEIITDRLFQLPGSPPTRRPAIIQDGEVTEYRSRLELDLTGTYPEYDGPQEVVMDTFAARALGNVTWRESALEDAYNPPQPVIKYRVVYFRYLDE